MRYFISSDIHSFYDEWMKALKEAGFDIKNKDHAIIVCGDLLDRGPKPLECLKFVNKLHSKGRAILIRGNHEDLLEELFRNKYPGSHDISNGTWDTVKILSSSKDITSLQIQFVTNKARENKELKKYLKSVIDYAEIGDNIFVHGWIPLDYAGHDMFWNKLDLQYNPDWREASLADWEEARWYNGMAQWRKGAKEEGKTIWCGHWHASWGHCNLHNDGVEFVGELETMHQLEDGRIWPYEKHTPFKDDGIIALDACTAHSKFVNVEVLEL